MMIIDSELYCHDHPNCSPRTFLLSSKEEVPFGRNEAHCLDRTYSNHQQLQPCNFSWKKQENNERKNNLSLSLPSHHTFMSLHRTFDIPSRDHWVGRQTLQTEDSTEVHNIIGAGLKRKITKSTDPSGWKAQARLHFCDCGTVDCCQFSHNFLNFHLFSHNLHQFFKSTDRKCKRRIQHTSGFTWIIKQLHKPRQIEIQIKYL